MVRELVRSDTVTADLIEDWNKDKSPQQQEWGMNIFKAYKTTYLLSDENMTRGQLSHTYLYILLCLENTPYEFLRQSYRGSLRDTMKRKLELIKVNCARMRELLREPKKWKTFHDNEKKYMRTICRKMDYVLEKVLYYAHPFKEELNQDGL